MTHNVYTETLPMSDATDVSRVERLERIADLMDSALRVPGTNFRLGLDTLLGLVPGIGDTLALLPGLYILKNAYDMDLPKPVLFKMARNVGIDWAVGSIPLLGDVFDATFKSNRRNVKLLKDAVIERQARAATNVA